MDKRNITMLKLIIARDGWKRAAVIKRNNVFHSIGDKCYYHPRILPSEPFLVSFGDNVFVATGVYFATHNMMNCVFINSKEYCAKLPDDNVPPLFAKIEIHNNVFIGAHATIMGGVTIGSNCIIGANSVVTKDVPDGAVVAGCPAKVIGSFDGVFEKYISYLSDFRMSTNNVDGTFQEKANWYFWR